MKKKFVFLGILVISFLVFSSMAFASEKKSDVSEGPIKILSMEPVPYEELPADVKEFVDKQEAKAKKVKEKESAGEVTIQADYFADAYISCSDTVPLDTNKSIYVTTSSYPGGLWVFEAVDLDSNWGVIPVSPSYSNYNENGAQWSWGSAPGETKTVKVVCQFIHSGDYKLHVWGGAGIFSHADDVKIVTTE